MTDNQKITDPGLTLFGGHKMPMIKAIVKCKCPVCTKGDMFKTGALNLARFDELKEECQVCGYDFMPEPGFYQISLYFTYAINVIIFIISGVVSYFIFNDPPMWVYMAAVTIPAVITVPWNLRYSKVVMLYVFGNAWSNKLLNRDERMQ